MPEVYFSRRLQTPRDIVGNDLAALDAFQQTNGFSPYSYLVPGTAYWVDGYTSPEIRSIIGQLNSLQPKEREALMCHAETTGDEIHTMAAFIEQNLDNERGSIAMSAAGALVGAMENRLTGFQKALRGYQKAVLAYRDLYRSSGPGIGYRRQQAQQKVRAAYEAMSKAYRSELARLAPEAWRGKNRGNVLSNAERGLVLAARSPHGKPDPRLNIADTGQARRLVRTAHLLDGLGKMAVGVDAGLRAHQVKGAYDKGEDWLREASKQMAGFGFGGGVGTAVGRLTISGGTALAAHIGLVAGPIGWAVVGTIVAAGVLAGLGVGLYMDGVGRTAADEVWKISERY